MSLREGLSSATALAGIASVKVKAKSQNCKSLMSNALSGRNTRRPEVASAPVLFVANLFQPSDVLAVLKLGDGDMRHCGRWRCPVPMLQAGRKPDDIAWPNFFDRPAVGLAPAEPRRDDQRLAKRMCVPRGARARLERDMSDGHAPRIARLK